MKVKICGIQTAEHAIVASEAGADAIGFMFAKSKRRVSPQLAKEICLTLPASLMKVGVFVNEAPETVSSIVQQCGITTIQLHGEEKIEDYRFLHLPIIKAVHVPQKGELSLESAKGADYILLEPGGGVFKGGNGKPLNWESLTGLHEQYKNLIVAGGLNPENVFEAIRLIKPAMVDVSSGVEVNGLKNSSLIEAFIHNAKGAV